MHDELKQDFDSALIKHLLFKSKLRSYLYGNGTTQAPLRDPQQCALGQWIAARALGPYAQLPELRELDRLHIRIHQEANRLMDLHDQNHQEKALAGLATIELMADQLTQLLRTMEARLRTGQ